MGDDDIDDELVDLGNQLAAATAHRAQIMQQVRAAIRRAAQAGVPRNTIADRLGVSRQTVYQVLKDESWR